MEDPVSVQMDWRNTRESVERFRTLLLCSRCSGFMKEPVCVGMCEHMLCRSCAGPGAGDGCVVCHSPAWVKDIQINRQLSSIVQLFCGLESLLGLTEEADSSDAVIPPQPESPVLKHKKNFKIWFSPRSRKVRCKMEKPAEVSAPDSRASKKAAAAKPESLTAQGQDLSVFNFTLSSQDSGSGCSEGCKNEKSNKKKRSAKKSSADRKAWVQAAPRSTRKQSQQRMKKSRLEAINQQWRITAEADALKEEQRPCAAPARRSSKRVSFLSPAVTSEEPQPEAAQQRAEEVRPDRSTVGAGVTTHTDQTQPPYNTADKLPQNHPDPAESPQKHDGASTPKQSSKRSRVEEKLAPPETTPKRPRASPGRRRNSLMSPAILNPPSSASPGRDKRIKKSPRREGGDSPALPAAVGRRSQSVSSVRTTSGSPAVTKRNHRGETLLHLAAIKGDLDAVRGLLDQGSDPNLKDNAGWTPLHEACNLGHLAVVEALLLSGALLNTPGYENDSPLHDAVRNGHPAVAKLLVQHGASQSVLNLHGKRPVDYAGSPEMLQIFREASAGSGNANTPLSPSAGLSAVSECARREEMMVFLSSNLSQLEQLQLAKLGKLLGGRIADTVSGSVSHVVVPEGRVPTTFSALLGLLSGCWIVKFSWVEACLQAGEWIPETEHEAGEGPQRSRINRCSLLPPLFDGCFFFLLGSFKMPPKDELARLLREGGGQLLSRQPKPDSDVTQTLSAAAYHASPGSDQALCTQYIIFDPRGPHRPAAVRRGKVWSAPSSWVVDCIAAFQLLRVPNPQSVV